MKISIISVFPEIHESFFKLSIIGRAIEKGFISVKLYRFSDFCVPKERIDEPTAGPGAGMIIKPEVIERAIQACEQDSGTGIKIFFSPQGTLLTQRVFRNMAFELFVANKQNTTEQTSVSSSVPHLILVCPRYEGIDARVESVFADYALSIGDYVVMGGDVPAQVFLEGLLRLYPGIIGTWESVEKESFSGPFLDHPEYGLPVEWKGERIPDIVQSGNHAAINEWRRKQACAKTIEKRFDWFVSAQPTASECAMALEHIPPHYIALMHTQVNLKEGKVGTTSITSIDLHDTARSCATYGIKNFFMVNPLKDQQEIIATFLNFWRSDVGKNYNRSRFDAVNKVRPALSLDEVLAAIREQEGGKEPLLVATSARHHGHANGIDFYSQGEVWKHGRPVLFIFGTGQGLADEVLEKCDYMLGPVQGLTTYNHLSVRSAMAIILDRWLGLHPKIDKKH